MGYCKVLSGGKLITLKSFLVYPNILPLSYIRDKALHRLELSKTIEESAFMEEVLEEFCRLASENTELSEKVRTETAAKKQIRDVLRSIFPNKSGRVNKSVWKLSEAFESLIENTFDGAIEKI